MTTDAMSLDDLMKRAGARWCDEHDRWECVANKKPNGCHASAIRGMKHCRHHVGKATDVARTQGEANLLAWSTAPAADAPALDPGRVVMDQLRVAVMRADVYGELLRLQVADEEVDGLVGPTYAAGRDGARVETGEQVRGLAKLEAEWRDRAVRFAKAAHDMGIAERHIELQQAQAQIVVSAARVMLDELQLVPADRDRALRAYLRALGVGPETVAGEVTA